MIIKRRKKFKHEAEYIDEACDVDLLKILHKFNEISFELYHGILTNEIKTISQIAEKFDKTFDKRELAVLITFQFITFGNLLRLKKDTPPYIM